MRKAGELGLLAIDVPEEYGGLDLPKVISTVVAEELSGSGGFSVTYGAHTSIGTLPLVYFGTEEQKRKYLPSSQAASGSPPTASRSRARAPTPSPPRPGPRSPRTASTTS